jgi:ankyrin repeat protein
MAWAFFWLQIGLVVAALALAWVGLRGRSVDNHPHCRKCGYDLYGRPAGGVVCPECGSDLKQPGAVRSGQRRRQPGFVVAAVACVMLAYGLRPVRAALMMRRMEVGVFLRAVQSGDERLVDMVLSDRPDLIKVHPPGQSLLDLAVSGARGEGVVKRLIAAGADPNEIGSGNGLRPLHRAAWEDKPGVVQVLLTGGADPNVRDASGETPLHFAARGPAPGTVPKILLAEGADPNARDGRGRTPLHSAASGRAVEVVEVLVNGKADVNAANDEGRTPLHLAAARRDWDVTIALVKADADLGAKDKAGKVPAQLARDADPKGGVQFVARLYQKAIQVRELKGRFDDVPIALKKDTAALHDAGPDGPLLHVAAALRQTDLVRALLEAGADVNARDASGRTALHRATWGHDPRTVKLLLASRADANAADHDGRTPLHVAADSPARTETGELLLDRGADAWARDKQGVTPLETAATSLHEDREQFLEAMLARGVKPDVYAASALGKDEALKDLLEKDGSLAKGGPGTHRASPLHVAALHGRLGAARLLLDHGADPNAGAIKTSDGSDNPLEPTAPGHTPLFDAIGKKHLDVAELLLERGARVDVANAGGATPLHIGAIAGEPAVRLLLKHGAKPNVADRYGLTPLHLAAGFSDVGTVRALVEAGADITTKDAAALTALDHAYRGNRRRREVAEYLESLGAPSHGPPTTAPQGNASTAPSTTTSGHSSAHQGSGSNGADAASVSPAARVPEPR